EAEACVSDFVNRIRDRYPHRPEIAAKGLAVVRAKSDVVHAIVCLLIWSCGIDDRLPANLESLRLTGRSGKDSRRNTKDSVVETRICYWVCGVKSHVINAGDLGASRSLLLGKSGGGN